MKLSALVIFVVLLLLGGHLSLSVMQKMRYNDSYNCVDMSREAEMFFEKLGIRTYLVSGKYYKIVNNESTNEMGIKYDLGHRWIMLDMGLFKVPVETTCAMVFDPSWIKEYQKKFVSEGHINNGTYVEAENLKWRRSL
jgi:hypothetical protein